MDFLTATAHKMQSTLSFLPDEAQHNDVTANLTVAERNHLDSECRRGASGFLSVVPSEAPGLAFEPAEFINELTARLLVDI